LQRPGFRIGIDVGGTFTDLTMVAEQDRSITYFKVPSTPHDPSEAIERGIVGILARARAAARDVAHVSHGTTVATNIVIERKGARSGLLTTRGFRDVLEIGRQLRPHLYDYAVRKPKPLVARAERIEIGERIAADGAVLSPLDDAEVERALRALAASRIEAIAICFLHSYQRPEHEARAASIAQRLLPDAFVSVSSEILPEFREYERMSTTVVNAYVGPRMQRYLGRFLERVRGLGIPGAPYTIHSNGGLMSVETVRRHPVRTCLSGPAAGVVGAAVVGRAAGIDDLVTFDVGGTSTDVSLIHRGAPLYTSNRLVAEYPVKTPMIDIHVIGAGGGSIAWIDAAGALKVGPRSAGAMPGPVAYGLGGVEPTLTDANICLGRLDPVALLDGALKVDAEAARAALLERIAKPLGLGLEDAAHGIIAIANSNMARAIRSVSTERGYDLRAFTLCAFGGAGPLHAAEVAVECGIPRVLAPQEPGTMCARGMLLTDISLDFVRSVLVPADAPSWPRIAQLFAEMIGEGQAWLEGERVAPGERSFVRHIEARYDGQNFEVRVEADDRVIASLEAFIPAFAAAHRQEYGYDIPGRGAEIVNCRVKAVGRVPKARQERVARDGRLDDALLARRRVHFGRDAGWQETPVYARGRLPTQVPIAGPAIVNEMSATSIVLPGQRAFADAFDNLVIETAPALPGDIA
jgi:N-methylhydantoinase A